jgi:hypothetical protein
VPPFFALRARRRLPSPGQQSGNGLDPLSGGTSPPSRGTGACHARLPVSLFDEIFPSERKSGYVQTEWAQGWGDIAAGFGYAAEHLTEHRLDFGATIDQTGLALFFLQRHRVELELKALLQAAGAGMSGEHSLARLWALCESTLKPRDPDEWRDFATSHADLIEALNRVDEGSYTFRYPVDRSGQKVDRPQFINPVALHEYVEQFSAGVSGYIDYLTEGP